MIGTNLRYQKLKLLNLEHPSLLPGSAQDPRIQPAGEFSWDIKGSNLIYYLPRARGWLYTSPFVTSAALLLEAD